jgi:hypothetical protein
MIITAPRSVVIRLKQGIEQKKQRRSPDVMLRSEQSVSEVTAKKDLLLGMVKEQRDLLLQCSSRIPAAIALNRR